MFPFGGILIAPIVAGYLASLLARRDLSANKRPAWGSAWFAVVIGVVATWLATFRADLFRRPGQSAISKAPMPMLLVITGFPAAVVGIAVAFPVTHHYKRKHERSLTNA